MIGSGLKKYAQAHEMKVDAGCAYGRVHGWHIMLEDGMGFKALTIFCYAPSMHAEDGAALDARILNALGDCDSKEYRLAGYAVRSGRGSVQPIQPVEAENGIARVTFADGMGTMKRITAYIDEVLPRLDAAGIDSDVCAVCGKPLGEVYRYVHMGNCVLPVHDECVSTLSVQMEALNAETAQGSVGRGALGALIGALLGAIVWALVLMLGYITSLVGLLIGWLANCLYQKFGGRPGRARVIIVAVALVLGLLLGQIGGYTLQAVREYNSTMGIGRVEFVREFWEQYLLFDQETALGMQYDRLLAELSEADRNSADLMTQGEFVSAYYDTAVDEARTEMRTQFIKDYALGLFFSLLGCFDLFRRLGGDARRRRARPLK